MKNRVYPVALSLAVWSIPLSAAWTNVSNGLTGSVPGVAALAIDLSVGSTLYALTSANVIFKSTDTVATWKALGNIAGVNAIVLDPTTASTVYAATAHGVVKTSDGGASWVSAGLGDASYIYALAIDPRAPTNVYVATDVSVFPARMAE